MTLCSIQANLDFPKALTQKDKCKCLWVFYCHLQTFISVKTLYYAWNLTFGSNLSHGSALALRRVMIPCLNWYGTSASLPLMKL